jgi:hypothetical protein
MARRFLRHGASISPSDVSSGMLSSSSNGLLDEDDLNYQLHPFFLRSIVVQQTIEKQLYCVSSILLDDLKKKINTTGFYCRRCYAGRT